MYSYSLTETRIISSQARRLPYRHGSHQLGRFQGSQFNASGSYYASMNHVNEPFWIVPLHSRCLHIINGRSECLSLMYNGPRPNSSLSWDKLNQEQTLPDSKLGDALKACDLDQTQTAALSLNDQDPLLNIDHYTTLMNTILDSQKQIIESDDNDAAQITLLAQKAHDLLVQMEDISGVSEQYSSMRLVGVSQEMGHSCLRPTSLHYNAVIAAFANAIIAARDAKYTTHFTKNAPYIAQRWLLRMETLASEPGSNVTPTVPTYHRVMEACAASGAAFAYSKAPILTQAIFDKMMQNPSLSPTVEEYRLLLRSWCASSCTDAAYRASGVWISMQKAFNGGADYLEPSLDDGKMVLNAWSRAVNKHSARRALNILSKMEGLYSSKKTTVRPDLDCYRCILKVLMRSDTLEPGSNIPKIFKTMDDNQIFPDTECFDAALGALANCARHGTRVNDHDFHEIAEEMLERMEKEQDRSSVSIVKPSAISYTYAIQALSGKTTKCAAEKADALLKRMETKYFKGDQSMKPTRDSYVAVIHAYGSSGVENRFAKSNEVLQRMIKQYIQGNDAARPDPCSYHALISACASMSDNRSSRPELKKEAFLLAVSTVQDMKTSEHVNPTSKSYLLLLQCCNLLAPGVEREKALCSIFRRCAKDGLVNQQVIQEFQSALSYDAYHSEVVSIAPLYGDVRTLPEKWTRNLGFEGGGGRKSPVISVTGAIVSSTACNDFRMTRLRPKRGKILLQGGRL